MDFVPKQGISYFIFMKSISLNEFSFKLIINLFDMKFLREKLQSFHYTN